jgi:hypothetical protein
MKAQLDVLMLKITTRKYNLDAIQFVNAVVKMRASWKNRTVDRC